MYGNRWKKPIGLKIKKISTFIIHAKIKNADGGVGFMQQKKSNSKKRGWKLSVCSLIAAMVVVMAMFVAPITSKADAIHYLRPYQVTDGKVFDGDSSTLIISDTNSISICCGEFSKVTSGKQPLNLPTGKPPNIHIFNLSL